MYPGGTVKIINCPFTLFVSNTWYLLKDTQLRATHLETNSFHILCHLCVLRMNWYVSPVFSNTTNIFSIYIFSRLPLVTAVHSIHSICSTRITRSTHFFVYLFCIWDTFLPSFDFTVKKMREGSLWGQSLCWETYSFARYFATGWARRTYKDEEFTHTLNLEVFYELRSYTLLDILAYETGIPIYCSRFDLY